MCVCECVLCLYPSHINVRHRVLNHYLSTIISIIEPKQQPQQQRFGRRRSSIRERTSREERRRLQKVPLRRDSPETMAVRTSVRQLPGPAAAVRDPSLHRDNFVPGLRLPGRDHQQYAHRARLHQLPGHRVLASAEASSRDRVAGESDKSPRIGENKDDAQRQDNIYLLAIAL